MPDLQRPQPRLHAAGRRARRANRRGVELAVALDAVIVAVSEDEPRVLVRLPGEALPAGPFDPAADATLEMGLRRWVTEQTQLELGHAEQLYTFGDRDRDPRRPGGPRMLSISYLAFVRESAPSGSADARWRDWYAYFPWEDWRAGRPPLVDEVVLPRSTHGSRHRRAATSAKRANGARGAAPARAASPGIRSWCWSGTSCSGRSGSSPSHARRAG